MYTLRAKNSNAAIIADPKIDLLDPVTANNADIYDMCVQKNVYPPNPFAGIFLGGDLKHVEGCSHPRVAIVDAGVEEYCWNLMNWLQVDLTR